LGIVLQPAAKSLIPDPIQRSKFVGKIGSQFNRVGWGSLVVLSATGVYNLVRFAGGVPYVIPFLLQSTYGAIIDAKILLFLGMALITAVHTFISGPKVRRLIHRLEENKKGTEAAAILEKAIHRTRVENGILMGLLAVFALATLFFASLLAIPP
jgi:uncharacterized membrane protein